MLRSQGLLSTGLGLALVAPIAAPRLLDPVQAQRPNRAQLETRLEQNLEDLAQLETLRPGVLAGDPAAIQALIAMTEPGPLDVPDGDAQLQALRLDIAQKEQHLARVQQQRRRAESAERLPSASPSPEASSSTSVETAVQQPPAPAAEPTSTARPWPTEPSLQERAEADSTPALLDPETAFRRARSSYLAGEHLDAFDRFRTLESSPSVDYWTARCLERLDRNTEALQLYTSIAKDPDATEFAELAKEGAEFLSWKAGLEESARQLVERTRRPGASK